MATLIHYSLKCFKYVAALLILLLPCIPVNANHVHPQYKIAGKTGVHKHQSEGRLLLVAVIDSDDKDIGERCEEDLDDITFTFSDLAFWLDLEWIEPKVIKGDDFSKDAVNDAINNWLPEQHPGSNDLVVFYYSGHGFRFAGDADDYPRMWLKTGQDQTVETNNLKVDDIYNRIAKSGAGINLVISDCCNTTTAGESGNFNNAGVPVRARVKHTKPGNNDDDDMDYSDKLFNFSNPYSILVTAASKDEYAGGKPDIGGFFTYYFVEALEKCVYDEKIEPSWENIFKYADDNAGYWARSAACPDAKHNAQGRCIQTLKYKIDNN